MLSVSRYVQQVDTIPDSLAAICAAQGGRSSRYGQRRRNSSILEGDVRMCEAGGLQMSDVQKRSAEHMTYSYGSCSRGPTCRRCFCESSQSKENDPSVDEIEEQRDESNVWDMGMAQNTFRRQQVGRRAFLNPQASRQPCI